MLVGKLKRVDGDPTLKIADVVKIPMGAVDRGADNGRGILIYLILIGALVAYITYNYAR